MPENAKVNKNKTKIYRKLSPYNPWAYVWVFFFWGGGGFYKVDLMGLITGIEKALRSADQSTFCIN